MRLTCLPMSLLLSALLAASVPAQTVESVTPATGTIGTVIEIGGSGFGPFKPKAWLQSTSGAGPKYPLKLFVAIGNRLRGEIRGKQMPAGDYEIFVDPKGPAPVLSGDVTFSAVAPTFLDHSPKTVVVGGTVTVRGADFGSKKGKVLLDGRALKVLSWEDDRIHLRASHSGSGPLTIRSRSGEVDSFCSLGVVSKLGSIDLTLPLPFDHVALSIGHESLDGAVGPGAVRGVLSGDRQRLSIVALTAATPPRILELVLQVEPAEGSGYPETLVAIESARLRHLDASATSPPEWVAIAPPLPPGASSLLSGCGVSANLELTMFRTQGAGPEELTVRWFFRLDGGRLRISD